MQLHVVLHHKTLQLHRQQHKVFDAEPRQQTVPQQRRGTAAVEVSCWLFGRRRTTAGWKTVVIGSPQFLRFAPVKAGLPAPRRPQRHRAATVERIVSQW